MNADEARRLSEYAIFKHPETARVLNEIETAAKEGLFLVVLPGSIPDAVDDYLGRLGYSVLYNSTVGHTRISWEP